MENFDKQKTLQTLTIAQTKSKDFFSEENTSDEQKREFARQMLYPNLNIKEEIKQKPKLSIQPLTESAEVSFEEQEKQVKQSCEIVFQELETEVMPETVVEEEREDEIEEAEETIETAKIIIEPQKKKNFKLRLKLAICAFALILTCLGGWAIYNAIEIKTLTAEAQAAKNQYNINVATVISNISKLDDLTNPNSITNLDELSSAEILPITPKDKTAPTKFEKESNWFDRVCNWFSNLFN